MIDYGASESQRLTQGHRNRDGYSLLYRRLHLHEVVPLPRAYLRGKGHEVGGELQEG